ncbi:MAG: hypothetical protein AAF694_16565 [Bacteroidota bacterium]
MDWKELESYIESNRELLDVEEPREGLWDELQKSLDTPKVLALNSTKMRSQPVWKVAASLLIAVSAFIFFLKFMPSDGFQQMTGSIPTESIYNFSEKEVQELEQATTLLMGEIERYEDSIKLYQIDQFTFSEAYLDRIDAQREIRKDLGKQLKANPGDEHVLYDLVEAHKAEIEIWREFIDKLEEEKS